MNCGHDESSEETDRGTKGSDYVIRMKEREKDIFYTTGESEKAVENSPSKAEEEANFCYQGRIEVGR
ncbi:hypothetical protein RJ640_009236 [Escallonia rubra]|uniref:Uncharacterized protein n=1 Tax=Escallonia rubra TaxID=112253 RepID=A0AA88RAI7_9ASTE|nr:hypothetical protein RJ640_009236 [Escallonia rubra]